MGQTTRRIFLLAIAATGTAAIAAAPATAAGKLDEKDPQAAALRYVSDTAKADAKKYPQHAAAHQKQNRKVFDFIGSFSRVAEPAQVGVYAGIATGLISKPSAAARRLSAATLRWRCCSS